MLFFLLLLLLLYSVPGRGWLQDYLCEPQQSLVPPKSVDFVWRNAKLANSGVRITLPTGPVRFHVCWRLCEVLQIDGCQLAGDMGGKECTMLNNTSMRLFVDHVP